MSKEVYKVSVYYSRMPFPLSLFVHCFIVTEHLGSTHRYEVFHPDAGALLDQTKRVSGNIFKDTHGVYTGLRKHRWQAINTLNRRGTFCYETVQGAKGSEVHKMYTWIHSKEMTKYTEKYSMYYGPNSNTFIQWIVDQFPHSNLSLPWNAWGKNYRHEK